MNTIGIVGTGRFASVLRSLLQTADGVQILQSSRSIPIDNQHIFPLPRVLNCDIVFLCIPISALLEFLQTNVALIKPKSSSLFVDVCSVKMLPVQWMLQTLPEHVDILATHPLFGPDSTKLGTTFAHLRLVHASIRIRDQKRLRSLFSIFCQKGIELQEMDPTQHDLLMAKTQAVSFIFGQLGLRINLKATPFDTKGFRLLLQNQQIVSNDTTQLFRDLIRFNPHARQTLTDMKTTLLKMEKETNGYPFRDWRWNMM